MLAYTLSWKRRDDLEFLPVISSLPPQQTVLEYLIGCWKRLNTTGSALLKTVGALRR